MLTLNKNFHHQLLVSICPCKRGILGQKNPNRILFYKNQFNLLINVFEQHLLNGGHICSWMLKLCTKTLQCATKVLPFCFEVENNSTVILKRDIIQYGNVEAV